MVDERECTVCGGTIGVDGVCTAKTVKCPMCRGQDQYCTLCEGDLRVTPHQASEWYKQNQEAANPASEWTPEQILAREG
jgi:hypothetical protein